MLAPLIYLTVLFICCCMPVIDLYIRMIRMKPEQVELVTAAVAGAAAHLPSVVGRRVPVHPAVIRRTFIVRELHSGAQKRPPLRWSGARGLPEPRTAAQERIELRRAA